MYKKISSFIICAVALVLVACTEKAPVHKDLEGYWKTDRIINRKTGTEMDCYRHFWAFQLGVSEVKKLAEGATAQYISLYQYDEAEKTLRMYEFRNKGSQSQKPQLEKLQVMGISSLDVTFDVVSLDDDKLTLQSEDFTIYFHSY